MPHHEDHLTGPTTDRGGDGGHVLRHVATERHDFGGETARREQRRGRQSRPLAMRDDHMIHARIGERLGERQRARFTGYRLR